MMSQPERYHLLGPGGRRLLPAEIDALLMEKLILQNMSKLSQHGLVSLCPLQTHPNLKYVTAHRR